MVKHAVDSVEQQEISLLSLANIKQNLNNDGGKVTTVQAFRLHSSLSITVFSITCNK